MEDAASSKKASNTPAVRVAVETIRNNIRSGKYASGSTLPSEHELAAEASVSRGTIRRAIETLVETEEIRRKHYSRPIIAPRRAEIRSTANEIHVWISQPIANPVSLQFLQGVSAGLMGTKYRTVVREPIRFYGAHVIEEERQFLSTLLEAQDAVGAILERDSLATNDDLYAKLIEQGRHLVFVDVPAPEGLAADHVGTNNCSAARKGTMHLVKNGHQDIVFVADSEFSKTTRDRIKGFWRGIEQAGPKERGRLIVADNLPPYIGTKMKSAGTYTSALKYSPRFTELAQRAVHEILSLSVRPTAVFVNCDALAFWIATFLQGSGIQIPNDIAIMGFDWLARWEDPSLDFLTTMNQDFEGFGLHAADLLLDRLAESIPQPARHVLLDAPLIIRCSTIG